MTLKEMEARLKTLTETVEKQEARLKITEDIEEINKLQRAYGYYLQHWQAEEIIGLFSQSPDASV